jgi:hypothetical protein
MMKRIKLTNSSTSLINRNIFGKSEKKEKEEADIRIHEQMNFGTSTEKAMTNTPIALNCEMNFCG